MKFKYFFAFSATLLFFTFTSKALHAQSAKHQLEIMTGQTINDYNSSGNYPSASSSSSAPSVLSRENDDVITDVLLQQAWDLNERGVKCYNEGNWECAFRSFRDALKYCPNNSTYQQNYNNAKTQLDLLQNINDEREEYAKEGAYFVKSMNANTKSYVKLQKKLKKELGSYVPPLTGRKEIKEGIILGMSNTQEENAIKKFGLKSPFSEETPPYFATSANASWSDAGRAFLDNLTVGKYTTLTTEVGKELVKKLENTHFDLLMAHSNGATVTEALLRADVITVKELHIMGGDRSLSNYAGYCDLVAQGKVEKIVVWLNPADFVPYGSSLNDLVVSRSYEKQLYQAENFNQFFDHTLKNLGASKNVEYRWLSGPEFNQTGQDLKFSFDAHGLEIYLENIRRYRALYGDASRTSDFKLTPSNF